MASIVVKTEPQDSGSLFQTCRLCLSEDSVESVFNEEGLQLWISEYLSIEISSEDHLSQGVCSICRIQLMEFHQFRERCHEVQSALKSEIHTENVDAFNEKAIIESPLKSHEDELLLQSFQNVVADELIDIKEIKIENHDNREFSASSGTSEHTNGTQAAVFQIDDDTEQNHQSLESETCHVSTARLKCPIRVVYGPKTIECVACGVTFTNRKQYNVHLQKRRHIKQMLGIGDHEETITKTEFQCIKCPASFPTDLQLYNHYCRSHKPRKFACTKCPKKYVSNHELQRHTATVHTSGDERPFECNTCQKTFKLKANLYDHKKKVHGPKLHRCDVCGASFSTRCSLSRHVDIHNKIKYRQ
ncbi:zinc finger protein 572 [Aedes albopictus]|uniref:C2h2-type zn-finger protein n=1 Tax=Aedes albopictus TaxID=7160 RepID=A0ABM1ZCJ4_AEDAL|nr:zinc finger protein 572-like [Aedes albopictus]